MKNAKNFASNQKPAESLRKNQNTNHKHICSYCFTRFRSKEEKTKHIENEHFDNILEPIVEVGNEKNMWEKVFEKTNQVILGFFLGLGFVFISFYFDFGSKFFLLKITYKK